MNSNPSCKLGLSQSRISIGTINPSLEIAVTSLFLLIKFPFAVSRYFITISSWTCDIT